MRTKSLVLFVAIFTLLVSSFYTCVSADVPSIKIVGSAPLTGPNSKIGKQYTDAANAYFNLVNSRGGIFKKRIIYNVKDDQYVPRKTVKNTISFLNDTSVDYLFGFMGTPTITRALPLIKNNDKVLLFPFSGSDSFRSAENNRYFLHLRASYSAEINAGVSKFIGLGRKRIAVLYQNDSYGRSGWASVRQFLGQKGLSIVSEAAYRRGATFDMPYQEHVQSVLSGEPDAIVIIGSYQASAGFIRDLRGEDPNIPVLNISFVGPENLLSLLQAYSDKTGGDISHNLIQTSVVPLLTSNEPAVQHYTQFVKAYQPNVSPTLIGFEGFLASKYTVYLLSQVRAKSASFRDLAISAKPYDIGLNTLLSLSGGKPALNTLYFATVSNGDYVEIKEWNQWQKK